MTRYSGTCAHSHHRNRRTSHRLAFATAAALGSVCLAQESRVAVVKPSPCGTPVQVQPDERVGAFTVVNPGGRGPVAVVRLDRMPPKPDFNIITPAGISHPFKNGPVDPPGTTMEYQPVYVQDGAGGEHWAVISNAYLNGRWVARHIEHFPPGSQLVPDPPQPPGTTVDCLFGEEAAPQEEAEILALAGLPDNPELAEVWFIPSGEVLMTVPNRVAEMLWFQPLGRPGDVNGDGCIDLVDVAVVLGAFGSSVPPGDASGDVNWDGVVGLADVALILSAYGDGCDG